MKKERLTRASEYGLWEYCPRKWYLMRTKGYRPDRNCQAIKRGLAFHNAKSEEVKSVQRAEGWVYAILIIIGGLICILSYLH